MTKTAQINNKNIKKINNLVTQLKKIIISEKNQTNYRNLKTTRPLISESGPVFIKFQSKNECSLNIRAIDYSNARSNAP